MRAPGGFGKVTPCPHGTLEPQKGPNRVPNRALKRYGPPIGPNIASRQPQFSDTSRDFALSPLHFKAKGAGGMGTKPLRYFDILFRRGYKTCFGEQRLLRPSSNCVAVQ